MKIGIFDSGLGGLIITHSLIQALPQYDYLYFGDTARVPYGNRSQQTVYEFTKQGIEYLFEQDCELIIVACNTASAEALRQLQQSYLPEHYPDRRILGVLIPAAEAAVAATTNRRIGVLATTSTIMSKAFEREIHKLDPEIDIMGQPAPLLVPLIENGGEQWAPPIIKSYLEPLTGCDTVVLGCTHYPYFKDIIRDQVGKGVTVISQDEIVPAKLADYLKHHPELESRLSQNRTRRYQVTDLTDGAVRLAGELMGDDPELTQITL
jgi:glutamate racemase